MTTQLTSLIYLDRYRNEGTRTYSDHAAYTEAGDVYRPDGDHPGFDLTFFEVPRQHMVVHTANPPQSLISTYLNEHTAIFCIHPQVLDQYPDDPYVQRTLSLYTRKGSMAVIPSSSTRTLFAVDETSPHAIKVHFPFKISRYSRKMRLEVLEQAVNISRELEAGIHHLDDQFAFLREVIGVAHQNLDPGEGRAENWGYLVRDMTPFPETRDETRLIPGFALYGSDYFDPQKPLLLYELIGDNDPVAYVVENIMLPIIGHWVQCFLHFGYLLEPHGQNVLLEVGPDDTIRRIVHRDLSVGIDMRRRRDIGRPDDRLNAYNRMEQDAFHSITYDRFMGGHFFDRLVSACCQRFSGISAEDFRRPCREAFSRLLPDYLTYFPKTVWYFSEERDRYNKPLFRDTKRAPQWRP